ncbi:hypothetical protein GGI09_000930 [Coemansia sp. S100]|nr:hypothetical protein LPJ71_000318 [Coemansia sp. S17]KAJ2102955.1 hypothetical protein GGI09_000930 [Coemansia sp. S100]
MKFTIASLLIAATLASATSVEQNQACAADYVRHAGADNNVVVVTETLTVTAGAKPPTSSIKPTTMHSSGKLVINEVKTVTAGGNNEAAAAGSPTPASQAPAPTSQAAEIPVAQNSPAAVPPAAASSPAAASVPAKASSSAPPAVAPAPAQTPAASQAPQPSAPAASQAPQPSAPAASQAPQPTSGNPGGNAGGSTAGSTGGDSFTGDGTFFSPGLGSCGLTNSDSDLIAAIPAPQYGTNANPNNAEVCGKCALVKGPKGQVKVKITDRCPVCKTGDLDLSPSAFQQIGDFDAGRIPISWSFVAC